MYNETKFQNVNDRIKKSSLITFYKIKNGNAPDYLINTLPKPIGTFTEYNLRNNSNIRLPFCRTELYKRSFFPRTITLWNDLSLATRNSETLNNFKKLLFDDKKTCVYYYYGERWISVHHCRIRLGCSKLNADLCFKLHVIDNPGCICGYKEENERHYFFYCSLYDNLRANLLGAISNITTITLDALLYGNKNLSIAANQELFGHIHEYMKETKRFQ